MLAYEEMMEVLVALGEDVSYHMVEHEVPELHVVLEDFEGFDEEYEEVSRDYDDPELVESFMGLLHSECLSCEGEYYVVYHFDGYDVVLGYASMDI